LEFYSGRYKTAPPKGETYTQLEKRLENFLKEMEKKYKGKAILIVSHERPLTLIEKITYKYDIKKLVKILIQNKEIGTGEVRKLRWK